LFKQMHDAGYHVPDMEFVLCDLQKEGKVAQLCHHSEKLTIAFGLTSTSSGTPLHITKNLCVCCICHNSTKVISKIVGRKIHSI
jgi:hypothetical protein